MKRSVDEELRRILAHYDRGMMSDSERVMRIAELAIHADFFQHLETVPNSLIPELRDIAEHAPAHPEDCFSVTQSSFRGGVERKTFEQQERSRMYWSARRLREHFFPNRPLPDFDRLKCLGLVHESKQESGTVTIIGAFRDILLIREHPLRLIKPDGETLVTHLVEWGCDRNVDGIRFLQLDSNVSSLDDTPPKTEVWLDRRAVEDVGASPFE